MAAGSKERSEPPPEARLLPGTESETPLRYIRSVFIQIPDAAVKGRALLANRTQFGKKKRSLFRPHGGCCYRSRSAVMHRLCIAAQLSCHFDIAKPDRCARHSASSADFPSLACQPVVWKPPSIAFEGVCARARVVP